MITALSSNNTTDVFEAFSRTYWDHSCKPSKTAPNELVIVIPNKSLRDQRDPSHPHGIQFNVDRIETLKGKELQTWYSNHVGSTKKYPARIYFKRDTAKTLSKAQVDAIMNGKKPNQQGILYIK